LSAAARAIITRPAGQADAWLQALRAQGVDAQAFALIDIAAALSPEAAQALAQRIAVPGAFQACMWVSSNAVEHFLKPVFKPILKPFEGIAPVSIAQAAIKNIVTMGTLRHWATGAGTVAALHNHGVPASQIDAPDPQGRWDSEALWQRVAQQVSSTHSSGSRVLILRGEDVGTPSASRDWLADHVRAAGGQVEFAAVYQRRAPQFSAAQTAWAQQAAVDGSVWVFSSSQAVTHLPTGIDWRQARCVATHERIAQAAHARGFAVVCTSRPALHDVAQSLKSLL
jgi:uroporphyrinogen-III synthase